MLPLCWKGKQGICRGRAPEGILRLDFSVLLVGAALLVLMVPVAHAQSGGAEAMAQPGMESPGRYLVTFDLDQATLTEQDRQVIAQAAEDYRQGGSPQVSVTGYRSAVRSSLRIPSGALPRQMPCLPFQHSGSMRLSPEPGVKAAYGRPSASANQQPQRPWAASWGSA